MLYRLYKLNDEHEPYGVIEYGDFKKRLAEDHRVNKESKYEDGKRTYPDRDSDIKRLPYSCGKMDYRPAIPHVPSKIALEQVTRLQKGEKIPEEETLTHHQVWEEQKELNPTVGHALYFLSISMDAGWFRTSRIVSFDKKENGDVVIETENSVYLAERALDYES